MENNSKTYGGGGIGFFTILGLVFIILKLCKVISWAWWIVLMPFYLPYLIAVLGMVCIFLYFLIKVSLFGKKKKRR